MILVRAYNGARAMEMKPGTGSTAHAERLVSGQRRGWRELLGMVADGRMGDTGGPRHAARVSCIGRSIRRSTHPWIGPACEEGIS